MARADVEQSELWASGDGTGDVPEASFGLLRGHAEAFASARLALARTAVGDLAGLRAAGAGAGARLAEACFGGGLDRISTTTLSFLSLAFAFVLFDTAGVSGFAPVLQDDQRRATWIGEEIRTQGPAGGGASLGAPRRYQPSCRLPSRHRAVEAGHEATFSNAARMASHTDIPWLAAGSLRA